MKQDIMRTVYEIFDYNCFVCGKRANQLAHIIGQSRLNKKQYGKDVVDSDLNVLPACNLEHNALIDIGKNDLLIDLIVFYIKHGDRENIEDIVRGNVKRKRGKL